MTNRQGSSENADDDSRQHVAPVMFVVADPRQADVDRREDQQALNCMSQ